MRPASDTHATYLARPSWRSRLTSIAFTLAIVAIILLALLKMGAMPFRMSGDGRALSTFDVAPPGPKAERSEKRAEQAKAAPKKPAPRTTTPSSAIVRPPIGARPPRSVVVRYSCCAAGGRRRRPPPADP